ncbi:MAG: hypothetical protein ABSE56_15620 [Bryobacteraceae bacterium]|jgi:hypothetical protein
MKIGAQPKKLVFLGVLLLVLAYFLYSNLTSDDRPSAARAATPRAASRGVPADIVPGPPPAAETRPRPPLISESRQLRLTLKDKHADPTTTDPTLRLDLLAKVQTVNLAGGERNLFQFGAAPPPPVPERKIIPTLPPAAPPGTQNDPPAAVVPPPPPPIPLKFYGYSTNPQPSVKRVFFLQGDEIVVAKEGELIQRRYKVVRVAVDSCVVEDTETKNQQTLRLEEQQP